MSFSISFLEEPLFFPYDDESIPAAAGRLALGDEHEGFHASLFLWTKRDYETQWRQAIRTLLSGADRAALITEYIGPGAGRLWWWPMYKIDETVYLHEQILFFNQLKEPFLLARAFSFIGDRQTINDEGDVISEWSASLLEVQEFADSLET